MCQKEEYSFLLSHALLPVSELTMLTLEPFICVYFLSNFNEEDQHVGGAFYIRFFLVPPSAI